MGLMAVVGNELRVRGCGGGGGMKGGERNINR